jgi:hypothetical protein
MERHNADVQASPAERDGYPAGVPCWVDTTQPDPPAAVAFYGRLFGWQFEDRMPAGAGSHYFVATLRGRDVAAIGSPAGDAPSSSSSGAIWNTYVWVDGADDAGARVAAAGGRVVAPAFDVPGAGRMAECVDPAGASFRVWQAGGHRGAQLVNEPGTWNFSNLVTSDAAAEIAFYAAVFGWQTTPVDLGGGQTWMVRMPGYADFLEQRNPGVRARHAAAGAPEGFTDAVGWVQPTTDSGAPANWSVVFAVADADAVAHEAEACGGEVLTPPTDIPYARLAVVRDPWGAVVSVSQFKPPA